MGFKLNLPKPSFKIDWKGQVVPVTSAPGDGTGVDPYNLGIAQLQGPLDQATADAGDRQNAYDQSNADLFQQLMAQRDAPPEQNPGDILQPKEAGIAALVTALAALGGARLPYIQAGLQGYVGGKKTLADMKYSNKYRAWQTAMQDIDRLTQAKQFDYTSKANELNQAESKRLGLIGQMTGLRKEQIAAQKEQERTDRAIRIAGIGANSRENVAQINHQGEDPKFWMGMGFSPEKAVQYAASAKTKNLAQEQSALAMAGYLNNVRPKIEQGKLEDQQKRTQIMQQSADSLAAHRLWQQQHPNLKPKDSPFLKDLQGQATWLHQKLWELQIQDNVSGDAGDPAVIFDPMTGMQVNNDLLQRRREREAYQQQLADIENQIGQQAFNPEDPSTPLPGVSPGGATPSGLTGQIQPMAATPPSQRKGGGAPLVASKALGGGAKKKTATPLAPKKKAAPGTRTGRSISGGILRY